jgi:hypothetical protein
MDLDLNALRAFHTEAGNHSYSKGGTYSKTPERRKFNEIPYVEGDWSYLDSYVGYYRSWGTELIRYKDDPVWCVNYGGGIMDGKWDLAAKTFDFLKKALNIETEEYSARGPEHYEEGDWEYSYKQIGDFFNFSGYEEIYYKGELVFFHNIIGGLVKDEDYFTAME